MPHQARSLAMWFGPTQRELGWVWEKVRTGRAAIALGSVAEYQDRWPCLNPTHIFLASETRSDHLESDYTRIRNTCPEARVQVILGSWWVGHRRCRPLPESLVSSYWYQWYTSIGPRLDGLVETENPAPTRIGRILNRTKPHSTASPSLAPLALVLSDHPASRALWEDVLPGLDATPIASMRDSRWPDGAFQSVWIDAGAVAGESRTAEVETILRRAKKTYPDARTVVVDAWPRFEPWRRFERAGADQLVSQVDGLA